jgi:replicative DNA helicase
MNLPHDSESERVLIGSILLTNHLAIRLISELQPDDFYSSTNRQIFIAIMGLCQANAEITPVTIAQQLRASGELTEQGWMHLVTHCSSLVADLMIGGPEQYIKSLKEKSTLRRILQATESARTRVDDGEGSQEVLRLLEDSVLEIRQRSGVVGSAFRPMSDVMQETEGQLERLKNGNSLAVPTGFKSLDQTTRGGIQPGDVWVIASLTGRGKSSWALASARHQAEASIPVAVVSREMSDFENSARMLSAVSQIPTWKVEPGMGPNIYESLIEWVPHLSSLPMWFNSRTGNVLEIRSQIKELVRVQGVRSLFVDYLQLMGVTLEIRNATRAQEVATVSRVLKEIAMENQIGVFALAQFNRLGAHGELPELHHLAESSGIEKDASLVLILDMEKPQEGVPTRACTMRIAKHRNGPLLSLAYNFRGDILSFEELG